MTFQEACETGMPFVCTNRWCQFIVTPIDSSTIVTVPDWGLKNLLETTEHLPLAPSIEIDVVDWFEPTVACGNYAEAEMSPKKAAADQEEKADQIVKAQSTDVTAHPCVCHIVSLMQQGCVCGGK